MNEFELINFLTRNVPVNTSVLLGPGDDCAVLRSPAFGQSLLLKTDAVVEGIHFVKGAPPESVGHKAMARVLSDIAAMAGTPIAALITIGLPQNYDPDYVAGIYKGIFAIAKRFETAVVGGETTTNPERILVSISMLGSVPEGRCILRSGAQPGDAIFVSGELGGSLQGRHLEFEPRLDEARWLASQFAVHAMIDLSDGLAGDLKHILAASKVGAELLSKAIPVSRPAKTASRERKTSKTPLVAALTDGEDFELLFTVASGDAVPLLDGWKEKFPQLKLSCIGRITKEPGLILRDKTGARPLNANGYTHFR